MCTFDNVSTTLQSGLRHFSRHYSPDPLGLDELMSFVDWYFLSSIAGRLMSISPFRFGHVDNCIAVREFSGAVDLIIAGDNEATITILLKGRST